MPKLSHLGWMADALCKDENPKLFTSHLPEEIRDAKKICEKCPVKIPCITGYNEVDAIAGGFTRYERLKILWKRIDDERESNFRNISFLLKKTGK